MPLSAGARLGPYEIISQLGVGGMGEVYRAHDAKLNRDVALKVLLPTVANDRDRLARFSREAQLLASLNHPNIAHIHGIEDSTGVPALVMELVEGETLADRIARGPIDLDEAVAIARQIADALEAAHDRGVVHRDLKPANIKVRPDGRVKVLDFGLAKMFEAGADTDSAAAGFNPATSPTLTSPAMTREGMILGTAAYMSPEQARGRPVDRRTDIWAFGCVLFEMLTGRRTFESGETLSDAVAAILKSDPDWTAIPANTPPYMRKLLARCLQKDPQKRLPHIGLARLEIDDGPGDAQGASVPVGATMPRWRRAVAFGVVTIVAGGLGLAAGWYVTRPAPSPTVRFPIVLGSEQFTGQGRRLVAISPDGSQIAYAADRSLYRRALSNLESKRIVDSDDVGAVINPAFSPDGRSIAYVSVRDLRLQRVSVDGGLPVTICPLDALPNGVSWDAGGVLFEAGGSIMRVSADGGKPETLIARRSSERLHSPHMLPDGQTLLFTLVDSTANTRNLSSDGLPSRLVAQSLGASEPRTIVEGAMEGRYLSTGHLLYVSRGMLFAVPFDAARAQVTGGPVPLIEGVRTDGGTAHYVVSATGSLAYVPGAESGIAGDQNLGLIDRTGRINLLKLAPAAFRYPRLSPDGRYVAVGIDSGNEANIWIYDLSGDSALRRLTFGGRNRVPAWSADGQRIAFQSDRDGDRAIFAQRADGAGSAERLTTPDKDAAHVPESWSAKGDLLFTVTKGPDATLWTYSAREQTSRPFGSVQSSRAPTNAAFSPDGSWVAYQSNETGTPTVYVQPYPATGARFQASADSPQDDPHHPLWSRDGTELFYVGGPNRLVVVRVTGGSGLSFSNPVLLQTGAWKNTFGGPTTIRNYDVSRDGKQFLGVIASGVTDSGLPRAGEIQIVLNWIEELKARVPTK